MVLTRSDIGRKLLNAAKLMREHEDVLSEIDSKFGDGDHGLTIGKIARLIETQVPQWGERSVQNFLDDLGTAVMEVKGGSAGPLYGTLLAGLGAQLGDDENDLDVDGVRRMFAGALAEMRDITKAKVGDKTMMDALIPAVEAAQSAHGDVADVLKSAAAATEAGAEASKQFASKFGRARSYKEQTIGTPDAGAVSTALFIRGFAEG